LPSAPSKPADAVVSLFVIIDTTGAVSYAKAQSGPSEIAKPLENALRSWQYNSFESGGKPLEVMATVWVLYNKESNRYYTQTTRGAVFGPPGATVIVDAATKLGAEAGDVGFVALPDPDTSKSAESVQRVSGGVLGGRARSRPQPAYPSAAMAQGVTGEVVVQVLVDTSGLVVCAVPVSGPPLLLSASVAAARGWSFDPVLLDERPVRVAGTISFRFRRG